MIVTVRRDGRLTGCLPLSLERVGPLSIATLAGSHRGVPLEILAESDADVDALWGVVADLGLFFQTDALRASDAGLAGLFRNPQWRSSSRPGEHVPVIEVPCGSTATDIRSRRSLKRLRQYRSELLKRGGTLEIEVIDSVDHLDRRWPEISRLAEESTRIHDRVNYLAEVNHRLVRDFLRGEARAGRLTVAGLVINGQWGAQEIGIRTGERMEGWLGHYDKQFAQCQPGHQIVEWFVNMHDVLGVRELDQGVGASEFKKVWANAGYDVISVVAVPRRLPASKILVAAADRWVNSPLVDRVRRAVTAARTT